ncbi:oligosaccharide flippase family protein [Flavobacterium daemonense]|uniref:oligosaccharide flippase family protein n=1 Tax=Flavobacterium daemonense TaxID=1393049 RepID=UPI001186FD9F|nr:oligosaccharide flippase family protein [Flavobacterium daemonense]KAF2333151.1 oligosaccharide flippase family protein [Flavobacterium daemonense]
MSEKNSYKEIIKATSIFGGTQFIGILVSIVRSKLVAIFLGPAGMGIVGLLTSTTDLIGSLTNFGLRTSAVKNIAASYSLGNEQQIAVEVTILKRLVWITGLLGMIITFLLAPWLSQITFGNSEYTNGFRWICVILLFNQLTAGQDAVLQGMRKLKYLSLSSIYGSVLGLFLVVPIYYFFGVKGVVPVIIISSLVLMLLTWYFVDKIKIAKVSISKEKTWQSGKIMLKMGFLLSLSALLTTGGSYLLRIYISNTGTVVDVGLYNAGFAIIGTYVGMIFSAMGTDYYPRLSGVSHDKIETNKLINQQGEIGLLLLGPVLAIFMTFSGWAVLLLYSTKFLPVTSMIAWASLGMYFKASSWSISYIFLAKSDSKLFFLNELSVIGYGLFFNILGYYLYGLEGLGISFLLMYFFYFIQVFFVCKKKYDFILQTKFLKILVQQFIIGLCCFLINRYVTAPYSYFFGTLGCLFSIGFSLIELDKLFNLKSLIRKS